MPVDSLGPGVMGVAPQGTPFEDVEKWSPIHHVTVCGLIEGTTRRRDRATSLFNTIRAAHRRMWQRESPTELRAAVLRDRRERWLRRQYPWVSGQVINAMLDQEEWNRRITLVMGGFVEAVQRAATQTMVAAAKMHRVVHPTPQTWWQAIRERHRCRVCHPGWWR